MFLKRKNDILSEVRVQPFWSPRYQKGDRLTGIADFVLELFLISLIGNYGIFKT